MLIVLLTLGKQGRCCGFMHRVTYKWHLETRWNMWIRGIIESMLVLGLTSTVNLIYGVSNSVSFWCSVVILSTIGYTYLFVWYFVLCRRKDIYKRDRTTVIRFGILFKEMKTDSFWHLLYYPFFMTRRLAFVAVIVFIPTWPRTQCGILFTMCLSTLVYLAYMKPFIKRHLLALNIINETFITIVVFVCFYFITPKSGFSNKVLGCIVLGLVLSMIVVNLVASLVNLRVIKNG